MGMWLTLPASSAVTSSVNFDLTGFLFFKLDKVVSKNAIESFLQMQAISRLSLSSRKLIEFGELLRRMKVAVAPDFFVSSANFQSDKFLSFLDALRIKVSSSYSKDLRIRRFEE